MQNQRRVEKGDIILFEDSFYIQHVARVTTVTGSVNRTIPVPRNVSVIILMSIEESNLNTSNIKESEVIIIFEDCNSALEVEDKYPEVWLSILLFINITILKVVISSGTGIII